MSSRAWQREVAESVIAGHGEIAEESVDVGWSWEVACSAVEWVPVNAPPPSAS